MFRMDPSRGMDTHRKSPPLPLVTTPPVPNKGAATVHLPSNSRKPNAHSMGRIYRLPNPVHPRKLIRRNPRRGRPSLSRMASKISRPGYILRQGSLFRFRIDRSSPQLHPGHGSVRFNPGFSRPTDWVPRRPLPPPSGQVSLPLVLSEFIPLWSISGVFIPACSRETLISQLQTNEEQTVDGLRNLVLTHLIPSGISLPAPLHSSCCTT